MLLDSLDFFIVAFIVDFFISRCPLELESVICLGLRSMKVFGESFNAVKASAAAEDLELKMIKKICLKGITVPLYITCL